jgi:hypothetical protein
MGCELTNSASAVLPAIAPGRLLALGVEFEGGAELGIGVVGRAGGGATATACRWCRHPVPNMIAALIRTSWLSAAICWSGLPIAAGTLAGSGARAVVELFCQFVQSLRRGAQ